MRYPTNYYEYLSAKSQYERQGIKPPTSFEDTYYTQWIIDAAWQHLDDYANEREAFSVNWKTFEDICTTTAPEYCAQEWNSRLESTKYVLTKLRQDFEDHPAVYLHNDSSVTKDGRERLKQAQTAIDSIIKMGMIFLEQYNELYSGLGYPSMQSHFCQSAYPGKTEILEYLRNGNVHMATASRIRDCFTQEVIAGYGCLIHMNDQMYCWTNKLIYYIDKYHLRLPRYVETDILQKAKKRSTNTVTP